MIFFCNFRQLGAIIKFWKICVFTTNMWKRFISHYLLINLFTFNLCSNIFSSKFAAKIKRRDKIHKVCSPSPNDKFKFDFISRFTLHWLWIYCGKFDNIVLFFCIFKTLINKFNQRWVGIPISEFRFLAKATLYINW